MDLSKLTSSLDNTAQIDGTIENSSQVGSTISNAKQVGSTMNGLSVVHIAYTGGETDNIIVNIDKQTRVITATKKDIQFASKDEFPTIGSAKLIYVALDTNVTYIWNEELKDYIAIGKDYTEELLDINEAIKSIKDNTYTKEEVDKIANNIPKFNAQIVTELPTQNISATTIYLISKTDTENNDYYDEYMYINNAWEMIGNTKIDVAPATERTFGTVRIWEEDGYLCISTQDWIAFVNTQTESSLVIQGSQSVQQQANYLTIN